MYKHCIAAIDLGQSSSSACIMVENESAPYILIGLRNKLNHSITHTSIYYSDEKMPVAFGGCNKEMYHIGLKPFIGLHTLGEVYYAVKGKIMLPRNMKSFEIPHLNIEVHKQSRGGHPMFELKSTKVKVTARQWCIDVYRHLVNIISNHMNHTYKDKNIKITKFILSHPINNQSPFLVEELRLSFRIALSNLANDQNLDQRRFILQDSEYDNDSRISLIDESLAVMFSFVNQTLSTVMKKDKKDISILTFDCGAYTCDASLFRVLSDGVGAAKIFTVALCGSSLISGDMITSSLTDLVIRKAEDKVKGMDGECTLVDKSSFWTEIENRKKEMCDGSEVMKSKTIVCSFKPEKEVIVKLDTEDLQYVCKLSWESMLGSPDESITRFFVEVKKQLRQGTIDYFIPVGGGFKNNYLLHIVSKWISDIAIHSGQHVPVTLDTNQTSLNSIVARGRCVVVYVSI
jgi:hypothetical protein